MDNALVCEGEDEVVCDEPTELQTMTTSLTNAGVWAHIISYLKSVT